MSQRRRRRRRRGRGGGRSQGQQQQPSNQQQKPAAAQPEAGDGKRRRKRRRRGRSTSSPKSSEDLVRALPQPRPESLTAPADGQSLDELIGELQSTWGVPQYPQEYRLTLKVADPKDRPSAPRPERDRAQDKPNDRAQASGQPRREKAPPREQMGSGDPGSGGRKRRRRRRRRRGGGGGDSSAS